MIEAGLTGMDRVFEALEGAEETIEAVRVALASAPHGRDTDDDCRHLREAAALIRRVLGEDG